MPRFPADIGRIAYARALCGFAVAVAMPCGIRAPMAASSVTSDTLDLPAAETRAAHAPASAVGVYRLDGESLRRFATLEDAIASLPGFRVRRQGGLGGYSELSFRGARATAVEVYVDGARLNQDGDGAPDLSKWPSLWFASLEARTGLDVSGTGPGSLARIDLSTRTEHAAEMHARGGSFGTGEAAAQVQTRGGPAGTDWRWTLGVEGQTGRNDYPVFSDNGTVYNTADDATWNMDNNAYQSRGARGAARRGDGAGSQTFSILWLESRKEYPGLDPSSSRAYTRRSDWLGAWRMTRDGGPLAWEAGAQARRAWDSYLDPNRTLGAFSFEQARISTAAEADAAVRAPVPTNRFGSWGVRGDVRLRAEETNPTVTPFSQQMTSPAAQRYEAGGGLRVEARTLPLLPSALAFVAEARPALIRFKADGVRSFPSGPLSEPASETFTPVAVRGALEMDTRAGTWGLVVRYEPRAPSSGEYLGDNNGIQHNPALRPEETRAASLIHEVEFGARPAGASGAPGGFTVQTTVYANVYEAPIQLAERGASPFLHYENGADYRAAGVEVAARGVTIVTESSLSLTVQDAEISRGFYQGNRPPYQSQIEIHAEFFLKPVTGFRIGPILDARGPYYPGEANIPDSRRDAEWELGAHGGYERGPARFSLDVRNLFDRRYRDFAYSPRSGRSWSLTLSLNL